MSEDASQNAPHDLPLSILIGTVESEEGRDVEIPLILNTGGLLISGELIGESTFYKEFMGGAFRERIREVLSSNEALKAEIEKASDLHSSSKSETANLFLDYGYLFPKDASAANR